MSDTSNNRAWELDFARGAAVILMSAFHAVFDMVEYFDMNISYTSGFWFYIGRLSAVLFMFISGVSSSFSRSLIKRGITVLGCGMVITIASIPIMKGYYIRFGILHFFGTVMIMKGVLQLFIKDARIINIIAAASIPASIILGGVLPKIQTSSPLLLPFGVMPQGFASFDYYPLFPWLAFFSAGVLTASLIYKQRKSIFKNRGYIKNPAIKLVCFLGKHSLLVYLLHQPVIFACLYILFKAANIFS